MQDGTQLFEAAFVGWNAFQLAHFGPLLESCHKPTLLVPSDNRTVDTAGLQDAFVQRYDGHSFEIPRARMHLLDGRFAYLFSQTALKLSRPMEETCLFSVQYSLTKERHQYGPWHAEFDASFVYGPHSKAQVEYFCPAFEVGHLRLAGARKGLESASIESLDFSSRLDPAKPTILYAPTWGSLSSLDAFLPLIPDLLERYNILVRPHHNSMSRELHRLGAVPVDAGSGIVDTSAQQILVADAVVTDYSGFAFDALFLDRPVVLFRPNHESKLGVENLTSSSLEVVAAASIGPVATTTSELERALLDITEPSTVAGHFSSERHALLSRCFSEVDDPVRAIVDAIRGIEKAGRPSRAPQQLWVRDLLMSRARATRSRGSRKKPTTALKPRGLSLGCRFGLRSRARTILLRRRSLYVSTLAVAAVIARGARHRHYLAKLDEVGAVRTAAAIAMPRAALGRRVTHGLSRVLTRRPGAASDPDRANRLVQVSEFARNHVGDSLRLSVLASKPHWTRRLYEESATDVSEGDESTAIRGLRTLMLLRCLRDVDSAFTKRPDLMGARGGASVLKRLREARDRLQGLGPFADLASSNELEPRSMDMRAVSDTQTLKPALDRERAHVLLPPHFYAQWDQLRGGRRARNWVEVRDIYTNLLDSLSEDGHFGIVPRQQYFLNTAPVSNDEPYLSFFTKGGGSGNWHLKDAGILGLVSVDPLGFNGSSVFSRGPMHLVDELVQDTEPDPRLLQRIEMYFDRAGGDKYAPSAVDTRPATVDNYIFVPLQSTRGIEEASVPVDRLIPMICKAAGSLGVQLIFKRHPLCEDPLISAALARAQQASWVRMDTGDTWRLVQGADVVVTVNSGVVFQAIVAERPLVTLGPSDTGVVAVRGGWRHITKLLRTAIEAPVDLDQYRRFLTAYFDRYLIDPRDHQSVGQRVRLVAALSRRHAGEPSNVAASYLRSLHGQSGPEEPTRWMV